MSAHAGSVLRSARGARRLAQWQVARIAGISQRRLSALETGSGKLRPAEAAKLAPVLNVALSDLTRPARVTLPVRTVAPATWRVRSFRDIPATCGCDWHMTFEGARPSGWELTVAAPGCPHHGNKGGL